MVALGVTPEARDQEIAALRKILRLHYDEAKADSHARAFEAKAYETCANFQDWRGHMEKIRQNALMKLKQKRNDGQQSEQQTQQVAAPQQPYQQQPMAHYPPQQQGHNPQMQPYQQQQQYPPYQQHHLPPLPPPPQHQHQQSMMYANQMQHQQGMFPPGSYPPNPQQQQGWVQAPPYGYQIAPPPPPPQQQHMMAMNGGLPPQNFAPPPPAAATWTQPQPQPQLGVQNHYFTEIEAPVSAPHPPQMTLQMPSQVPLELERQHALDEFKRLQLLARQTFYSDAKILAKHARAAAQKSNTEMDQTTRYLLKAVAYIELEDVSTLAQPIDPTFVAGFAALLENAKNLVGKYKEVHKRKAAVAAAAAATAAALPQPASEIKEEEKPKKQEPLMVIAKDPTETLLDILKPDPSIVFPSAVAAQLQKNKLEQQQAIFPLPRICF